MKRKFRTEWDNNRSASRRPRPMRPYWCLCDCDVVRPGGKCGKCGVCGRVVREKTDKKTGPLE